MALSMARQDPTLPTTTSTPHHGIYKRKYHFRALVKSIAFLAVLVGYHVYNKSNGSNIGTLQGRGQQLTQQSHIEYSSWENEHSLTSLPRKHASEEHRRLSMVLEDSNLLEQSSSRGGEQTGFSSEAELEYSRYNNGNRRLASDSVDDALTCDDLKVADPGWLCALYAIGVLYMFLAIAIVCDEYFVEALEEISSERHMNIEKDVAVATLMAAGGSAPELFTNLFGTFDESEIGFGTIIGSAVFNVLLVIAACSIAAKETLNLTWWPLFRDSSYYAIGLIVLAVFVGVVSPDEIEWWEALVLFLMYIGYVLIMWKNRELHKSLTGKELMIQELNEDTADGDDDGGNLEAMKEKFDKLIDGEGGKAGIDKERLRDLVIAISSDVAEFNVDEAVADIRHHAEGEDVTTWEDFADWYRNSVFFTRAKKEAEDDEEPLYGPLLFPDDAGIFGKIYHLIQLPILVSLVYTIPDVRRPGMGTWCYMAFVLSILWIGFFAWWMVKWTEIIGNTIGVPHVVMGYTVLAAGTSVPDLLSSVIVTRQGSGDMAISSSIGSNIFDITVGLPIPWMIFMMAPNRPNRIAIDSANIWLSIFVFLGMLVLSVLTIHCTGWKLTKRLGGVMIVFYFAFLAQAIYLELPFVSCVKL